MNSTTLKTIIILVAFILLITGVYFGYGYLSKNFGVDNSFTYEGNDAKDNNTSEPNQTGDNDDGTKAPGFVVYNSEGEKVSFSQFIGKPVIINFWATWCPYCIDEMADFNEVYLQVKDDVYFLMINQTDGVRETKKMAEDYVAKEGFSFPVYFDSDFSASLAYGIQYLPTTIFIDAEGNFYTGYSGPVSQTTLQKHIDELR